ncbi:HAD family hydrolase [Persicirhabdus sediminis]|uniref:Haloacid dehalogenase-like hydrolase n=1 Tax=Persicirhabdus sediminis TaxID=454144 RepID=A0A8J7SL26_9BACT|nr:HAD family hydrolase [Persicirhabdus sediminis]MBK1792509.1 haloacid dehalogenase-like hydrolase [Persicirhabdus sediminis]
MQKEEKPFAGYALFDMDQTLVPWDMQMYFCNYVLQREGWRRLYLLVFVPFLPLAKFLGDGTMKRIFFSFLCGMRRDHLEALCEDFVADCIPSICYEEVLAEVEKNKQAGRVTVLNSASPEFYAVAMGKAMGFDYAYASKMIVEDYMPLFPDIDGGNNKGAVKLGRMTHLFPEGFDPAAGDVLENSIGYSDSHADLPMLRICEKKVIVHPTAKLQAAADADGSADWQLVQPARPTANKKEWLRACLKQILGCYQTH